MFIGAQVEAAHKLLERLVSTDLTRLGSTLNQVGVPIFQYGIKNVSVSVSVGSVDLSLSLEGEDQPRD